jgi:predicted phage terminase large subunit-like protein
MMQKVLEAYKMADNLGRGNETVEKVIGTRYVFGDLYENIEEMGVHKLSVIPAEVDELGKAKIDGKPVYLTKETLAQKKKKQGNIYYAQMLQTPLVQGTATFKKEWLEFYDELPEDLNYYILSDPATNPELSTTKRRLDFTSIFLIGAGKGRKLYVVDMVRDRIGLKDKWEALKQYHKRYSIDVTGYEEYGTQKDREFFLMKMDEERFYFNITPLKGSDKSKSERISMLTEFFMEGKILFPKNLHRLTKNRGIVDLVSEFIDEEYVKYPMTSNDDMLDTLAKICIIDIVYPEGEEEVEVKKIFLPSPLDETDNLQCIWGDL